MIKPVKVLLGAGATVPVGDNMNGQWRYLKALARCVPEAMTTLAEIATKRPGVKIVRARLQDVLAGRASRTRGLLNKPDEDEPDEVDLRKWAARWGFPNSSGCWMRHFRDHVSLWRDHPRYAGEWQRFNGGVFFEPVWPEGPTWNPNEQTEALFRLDVDEYIVTVKSIDGVEATPEFYERDFDSLVLQHAAGRTIREVLETLDLHDADESTIRKRNRKLAKLLGLTILVQRGRPLAIKRKK